MNGRLIVGVAIVGSTVVGLLASVVLSDPGATVFFVAYGGIGAYLALRRPTNSVGWWLVVIGWGMVLGSSRVTALEDDLLSGDLTTLQAVTAWANGSGWSLVGVGLCGLLLTFPNGWIEQRHRTFSVLVLGAAIGMAALIAFGPTLNVTVAATGLPADIPNPVGLLGNAAWSGLPRPDILFPTLFLAIVPALLLFLARFRRSVGLERLQYRWLVAAIILVVIGTWVWFALATGLAAYGAANIVVLLTYPSVPLAIAIAVLRYRLFEIDRLISRSIGWALVTGVLVVVFAGAVIALQAVLSGVTQGQTLAVAASTLVAFAIFQPVRRRVQSAVDRRFDRARYDAQRTVDLFAERLRDEMDLGRLGTTLVATADDAVRPTTAAVWLRGAGTQR